VKTREQVFERFKSYPSYVGNSVISVHDSGSGQQVNVESVQLDHIVPWNTIAKSMAAYNDRVLKEYKAKTGKKVSLEIIGQLYTLWDAKMYYNDLDNLQPMIGGLNASKGAIEYCPEQHIYNELNNGIAAEIGKAQTSWQNLQNALNVITYPEDENRQLINMLNKLTRNMNDITNKILK
jgi:hypothetical protein